MKKDTQLNKREPLREEFEKIWLESLIDSSNNKGDKLWSWIITNFKPKDET